MTIVSTSTYTGAGTPGTNPNAAPAAAASAAAPVSAPAPQPAAPAAPAAASAPAAPNVPASLALDEPKPQVPAQQSSQPAPAQAPANGASEEIVYDKTGDPGLDFTLNFLGKNGYTPEHPAMAAAMEGNFALLRADLASKGIQGYADILAVGEQSYAGMISKNKEAEAKTLAAVTEIAGGPEAWASIQTWANAQAEPAERAAVNTALKAGGFVAKAVARALAEQYSKAAGTSYEPRAAVPANAPNSKAASGVLSPEGYRAAIAELKSRVGGQNLDQHPEYANLVARRQAWRG